jgi:uncharacterized protein
VSHFYFDSSALIKRYLTEIGRNWVLSLIDPGARNTITIVEITQVEVAAALAARHRAPKGISRRERDGAVDLLALHCQTEYQLVALSRVILDRAVDLTQNHRLRGYDAIQLATALVTNETLTAASLPSLIFIAADDDLLVAARDEGLAADNPNNYP